MKEPRSIELPRDFPTYPTQAQAERVMRDVVSPALGDEWKIVQLRGTWLVYRPAGTVYGREPGERHRKFNVALANATGVTVVTAVSL